MFWNNPFTARFSLRARVAFLLGAFFISSSLLSFLVLFLSARHETLGRIDADLQHAASDILCVYLTGQRMRRLGNEISADTLPSSVSSAVSGRYPGFQELLVFRTGGGKAPLYNIAGSQGDLLFLVCADAAGNIISGRRLDPARNIPEVRASFAAWQDSGHDFIFYRFSSGIGETLAGADGPKERRILSGETDSHRVLKVTLYNGNRIECASPLRHFREYMRKLIIRLLIVFLILFIPGCAAGWLLATYFVRGMESVRRAAVKIAAGDLTQRVPAERVPAKELRDLIEAFNTMSDSNEKLITELRTVTDDIAHDLRTPLTRIRGTAEVAVLKCSNPECRESFGSIAEECDSMIGVIKEMLEISRAEGGIRKLDRSRFNLNEFLQNLFNLYVPTAEENNMEWVLRLPENQVEIEADRSGLQRVMGNLLDNAIKFLPAGGKLTLSMKQSGGERVQIITADTGPGIPDEYKQKVFQRFFRLDSSRTAQGNGLGLSLAAAIIHLHGGTIHVEDTPGGGASFIIDLPLGSKPQ